MKNKMKYVTFLILGSVIITACSFLYQRREVSTEEEVMQKWIFDQAKISSIKIEGKFALLQGMDRTVKERLNFVLYYKNGDYRLIFAEYPGAPTTILTKVGNQVELYETDIPYWMRKPHYFNADEDRLGIGFSAEEIPLLFFLLRESPQVDSLKKEYKNRVRIWSGKKNFYVVPDKNLLILYSGPFKIKYSKWREVNGWERPKSIEVENSNIVSFMVEKEEIKNLPDTLFRFIMESKRY